MTEQWVKDVYAQLCKFKAAYYESQSQLSSMKEQDNSDKQMKDEEILNLNSELEAAKSTIGRMEQNHKKIKQCLRYV